MTYALFVVLAGAVVAVYLRADKRIRALKRRVGALEKASRDALRAEQRFAELDAKMALLRAEREAKLPLRFRAQFAEDALLYRLFGGKLDGVFVEVGAYDGLDISVSYAFEALGWRGVLIEPMPHRFEACRRNRPGARVVHAALGPRGASGVITLSVVDDPELDKLSFVTEIGPGETEARRIEKEGLALKSVEAPYTTMDEALGEAEKAIDFAVIDVEGAELGVLQGFDLGKRRPRALLIEDNTRGADTRVRDHLAAEGYEEVFALRVNRLYVRGDDEELKSRAAELRASFAK